MHPVPNVTAIYDHCSLVKSKRGKGKKKMFLKGAIITAAYNHYS